MKDKIFFPKKKVQDQKTIKKNHVLLKLNPLPSHDATMTATEAVGTLI